MPLEELETTIWPAPPQTPRSPAHPSAGARPEQLQAKGHCAISFTLLSTLLVLVVVVIVFFLVLRAAYPGAQTQPVDDPAPAFLATTSVAVSAGTSGPATADGRCYHTYSNLVVNPLQQFPQNADSTAKGYVGCFLCTNGTLQCSGFLHGGHTRLIASHIHLVLGSGTGETGEGPPVINFCGSNERGLLNDGTPYPGECPDWDNEEVRIQSMTGVLSTQTSFGDLASRVRHIGREPGQYYFNFHSYGTLSQWGAADDHGMARGAVQIIRDV